MTALDFPGLPGWVRREATEPGAPLIAFEREASGKGTKNPLIVIKAQPWTRPLEELPNVTPNELRTASPLALKVLKEDWHPRGNDEYPYLDQLVGVNRIDSEGQEDLVLVHAVHMLMGEAASPGGQELMSFELVCRPDDEAGVVREFGEIISGAKITEEPDAPPAAGAPPVPPQEPRPPQPPQAGE